MFTSDDRAEEAGQELPFCPLLWLQRQPETLLQRFLQVRHTHTDSDIVKPPNKEQFEDIKVWYIGHI